MGLLKKRLFVLVVLLLVSSFSFSNEQLRFAAIKGWVNNLMINKKVLKEAYQKIGIYIGKVARY